MFAVLDTIVLTVGFKNSTVFIGDIVFFFFLFFWRRLAGLFELDGLR